ncbi:MAG: hypothetical protein JSS88_07280 [Actinobacteria bacterium]|nr:hypothetical protein [Actinomycetota bacterium]
MSKRTRLGASCRLYDDGLTLDVSLVADGERSGDHCRYELALTPHEGFLMDGPAVIEFHGEMERPLIVDALRWLADRLDEIGADDE